MSKSTVMSQSGKTQDGKTVLRIVDPIVFSGPSGEFAFAAGETWVFESDREIPKGLSNASEPYRGGALPHDYKTFSPQDYAKVMAPRPEPAATKRLLEPEILKRFNWTREQFHRALAHGEFPQPDGKFIGAKAPLGAMGANSWTELRINQWVDAIRALNVR